MVAVALDELGPLGGEAARGLGRVLVEARHLRPHQEAQRVRPVEPARVFRLLVLARAVEAERLRQLDVGAQRVAVARSEKASGEVALVEHQPLDERLAVQTPPTAIGLDLAQAEIRLDPVFAQPDLDVVEPRRVGMPRFDVLEGDASFWLAGRAAGYLAV